MVSHKRLRAADPRTVQVSLPPLTLEGGGEVSQHHALLWVWTEQQDLHAFEQSGRFLPEIPTVLLLPPLHHGVDPRGYWSALLGPGRLYQPWSTRIVSIALLGSDGGSSRPGDEGFPTRAKQRAFNHVPVRGASPYPDHDLPAVVTPCDQAQAAALALLSVGIEGCARVLGGSLGGMVAQAMLCQPHIGIKHVVSIAAPLAATATIIGWSHVQRELLHMPTPEHLSLARQIARMVYRGAEALEKRQGRELSVPRHVETPAWSPRAPFRMETYLRHHGDGFVGDAGTYMTQLSAMDHHDLSRYPLHQVSARLSDVRIESDTFVSWASQAALRDHLTHAGLKVDAHTLESAYGHDAFLVEEGKLLLPMLRSLGPLRS